MELVDVEDLKKSGENIAIAIKEAVKVAIALKELQIQELEQENASLRSQLQSVRKQLQSFKESTWN